MGKNEARIEEDMEAVLLEAVHFQDSIQRLIVKHMVELGNDKKISFRGNSLSQVLLLTSIVGIVHTPTETLIIIIRGITLLIMMGPHDRFYFV